MGSSFWLSSRFSSFEALSQSSTCIVHCIKSNMTNIGVLHCQGLLLNFNFKIPALKGSLQRWLYCSLHLLHRSAK